MIQNVIYLGVLNLTQKHIFSFQAFHLDVEIQKQKFAERIATGTPFKLVMFFTFTDICKSHLKTADQDMFTTDLHLPCPF